MSAASPQLPEQTLQQIDSLIADTTAADTVSAFTDTTTPYGRLAEGIERGGEALSRWDLRGFLEIFYATLVESVAGFVPLLFKALVIFAVLFVVYRVVDSVLDQVLDRSRRVDAGLQGLLQKTYRVVMLTLIAVVVINNLGFNVTALLAGLSIAGIAIGFAARDTLENFISGVTILLDRPFRVGDNIEMEDVYGTIEEITLRSTRLRTLNNTIMVLPNVHMITNKLVNHSMLGIVRVEIPFGIAYKEYPQEAREVVMKLIEGDDRLHPDYPSSVVVTTLNDSSVDMMLRLYLRNPKLEVPVRFEYIEKIREALRAADIEIPFPHRQLFIDEAKAFDETALMKPEVPLRKVN